MKRPHEKGSRGWNRALMLRVLFVIICYPPFHLPFVVFAQGPGCASVPAGLVSWWRAESNGLDSVGANNGSLQNGIGFSPGKVGNGFNLDGVDDYVVVNASSTLDVGTGAGFTIEGWINPASV